jgi:hypothetical protein
VHVAFAVAERSDNGNPPGRLCQGQKTAFVPQQHNRTCRCGSRYGAEEGRILAVLGEALRDKTANGKGVADNESLEIELFSLNILKQVHIAARRHVIQIHVRAHYRSCTRLNSRAKGRKIDVLHPLLRDVHSLFPLRGAIAGEVLQGREEEMWISGVP